MRSRGFASLAWREGPGSGLSVLFRHELWGGPAGARRAHGAGQIRVELKPGILDAESESIEKSLALLGIAGVRAVSTARIYDLEFEGVTESEAHRRAQEAVDRLLANPVIHRVTIRPPTA